MEILSKQIKFSDNCLKVFSSVLGNMAEKYFENPDNRVAYAEQKAVLTKEILEFEKRKKELEGEKDGKDKRKKN